MGVLYVCGQYSGVGTTALCAALATKWRSAGLRVSLVQLTSLDPGGIIEAEQAGPLSMSFTETNPVQLSPQNATTTIQSIGQDADIVIIEGIPLVNASKPEIKFSIELVRILEAKVLGLLSYDVKLSAKSARPWQETFGGSLIGLIVNRRTRYSEHDAKTRLVPSLERAGLQVFGIIPEERLLLAPTVRQVADHLRAQFCLWESNDNHLIEHFLIGGLILEWGINYFDRLPNQAVIVKGTRPDIGMAALDCDLNCLILTGGTQPTQYLAQKANEGAVPLLVVQDEVEAVGQSLESIQIRTSIHHPKKIKRFTDILVEQLDWGPLEKIVGLK